MGETEQRIQLTRDDLNQAETYANVSLSTTINRRHVNDAERRRDIRVGKLGELAWLRYLWQNGKAVQGAGFMFVNIPDAMDFATGNGETIDIKTASRPNHRRILVPQDQFENEPKGYYVGVRVDEETLEANICGYATWPDMAAGGVQMRPGYTFPAYDVEIRSLRPIADLMELIPSR